jgi:hypothetical protein
MEVYESNAFDPALNGTTTIAVQVDGRPLMSALDTAASRPAAGLMAVATGQAQGSFFHNVTVYALASSGAFNSGGVRVAGPNSRMSWIGYPYVRSNYGATPIVCALMQRSVAPAVTAPDMKLSAQYDMYARMGRPLGTQAPATVPAVSALSAIYDYAVTDAAVPDSLATTRVRVQSCRRMRSLLLCAALRAAVCCGVLPSPLR